MARGNDGRGPVVCPICGAEVGTAYTSPKMLLAIHLAESHIHGADRHGSDMHVAVRCSCGIELRGIFSLASHLLQSEKDHHQGQIEYIPLQRGAKYRVIEAGKKRVIKAFRDAKNQSGEGAGGTDATDEEGSV